MRKIASWIYICLVLLILTIPVMTMNVRKEQISDIDNQYLPELASLKEWMRGQTRIQDDLENYLNKRIGFRKTAVSTYENGVGTIFHKLEHPLYQLGTGEHIMGNMKEYIRDYQHLNLESDAEFVQMYAEWLDKINLYLEEKDIVFLYFLAPDKKTIYPEGMPGEIHVYGDVSRTDMLIEQIEKRQVPYIYPKEEFMRAKAEQKLYNEKYDVLHWNAFGNFQGNRLVDDYLQTQINGIRPLKLEQFGLEYEYPHQLQQSCFNIQEEVPQYYLLEQIDVDVTQEDSYGMENIEGSFVHFWNENCQDAPSILIFHDSYLVNSRQYYRNRYREIIMVSNANYRSIEELVEHYQPDIVLFENVERILASDVFDLAVMKDWQ